MIRSFALLLILAAIMLGAAESPAATQVGVVLPTRDQTRWLQDEARFDEALRDVGFTSKILFSHGSSSTERANVETLISDGAKVIILCPYDARAAIPTIEAAASEGVKIIAYDRMIPGTQSVSYSVAFDSESVGETQARYIADHASGRGSPLYLYAGALSDENSYLYFTGAWRILQPMIEDGTFVVVNSHTAVDLASKRELSRDEVETILEQITTEWDPSVARIKAAAHLAMATSEEKGDVFILAPNDATARSIADTFAKDPDIKSYVITGQDAEIESIQYILDGRQSMTVLKDTRLLTKAAVKLAGEILAGGTSISIDKIDVVTVDRGSFERYIIDSGYHSRSDFRY